MDACVPAPGPPGQAVCAMLDLLELQREVQRIRVGDTGFALAFDADGRLFAAGAGQLRSAVVSGASGAESVFPRGLPSGRGPPTRFKSSLGEGVGAGWGRPPPPPPAIRPEPPTPRGF